MTSLPGSSCNFLFSKWGVPAYCDRDCDIIAVFDDFLGPSPFLVLYRQNKLTGEVSGIMLRVGYLDSAPAHIDSIVHIV